MVWFRQDPRILRKDLLLTGRQRRKRVKMAYIVGARMPLLPLHQEQLGHHQGSNEDEDHFGMHGFVTTVLGMHACMLDPESQRDGVSQVRDGVVVKGQCFSGISYQSVVQTTFVLCSCRALCKLGARNTRALEDRHFGIE